MQIDVSRTADDVLVACHGRDLATLLGTTAANVGDFSSDAVRAWALFRLAPELP